MASVGGVFLLAGSFFSTILLQKISAELAVREFMIVATS